MQGDARVMRVGRIRLVLLGILVVCLLSCVIGCQSFLRAIVGYPDWARNENAATAILSQDLKEKATNPEVKEGLGIMEEANTKTANAMGGPTVMINRGNAKKELIKAGDQAKEAASTWGFLSGLFSWDTLFYLGMTLLLGGGGMKIGSAVAGKATGKIQGAFNVISSILARKQDKSPGSMDEIFSDVKWEAKARGQYENVKMALGKGGNESEPVGNGFPVNGNSTKGETDGK